MLFIVILFDQCDFDVFHIFSQLIMQILVERGKTLSDTFSFLNVW
jgi:hypothetical protein